MSETRAKRARRAERERRAREDAELQVREAAGQKVYRLPDGTLFIREIYIEPDQPYGGPPDGLDVVAEDPGPRFTIGDAVLDQLDELNMTLEDSEPGPEVDPAPQRRRPGLMSESEAMALIRQYVYPVGKHDYDP